MGFEDGDAEVEYAVGAEGGRAADQEGDEAADARGGAEGAKDDADGAEEMVGEGAEAATGGVEVDVHAGGVGTEERVIDAEDELVIPGGVGVAGAVHPGVELVLRVDPS